MYRVRKPAKLFLWLLLLSPVLLIAYCEYKITPPKDDWYIKNFRLNSDAFEILENELCSNKRNISIRKGSGVASDHGISNDSFARVQKALIKIGASDVDKIADCHIRVSIWGIGFAAEGDYKDYTRAPMIHDRIEVRSLDNIYKDYGPIDEPTFFKRSINHEWFVTYDVWP